MKNFNITWARGEAGLSQKELAVALAVDPDTVGRWERGARPLPQHQWKKITKICGVDGRGVPMAPPSQLQPDAGEDQQADPFDDDHSGTDAGYLALSSPPHELFFLPHFTWFGPAPDVHEGRWNLHILRQWKRDPERMAAGVLAWLHYEIATAFPRPWATHARARVMIEALKEAASRFQPDATAAPSCSPQHFLIHPSQLNAAQPAAIAANL